MDSTLRPPRSKHVDLLRTLSRRLSGLLDRLRPAELHLLLLTTILIGAVTGGAALLFVEFIHCISNLRFVDGPAILPDLGREGVIAIALLGGLVVSRFVREAAENRVLALAPPGGKGTMIARFGDVHEGGGKRE